MKKSSHIIQILAIIAIVITAGGCLGLAAGAAAGAAGLAYAEGALRGSLAATPPQVVNAAQSTLKDMGFTVDQAASDVAGGRVNGKTANGQNITIVTNETGPETSDISIRIGTFGDESLSRDIYNRIAARV